MHKTYAWNDDDCPKLYDKWPENSDNWLENYEKLKKNIFVKDIIILYKRICKS